MAQLDLKNVTKKYGDLQVIHGIDLSIKSGEFCVFVGPSGCGKSTLLRMIAGLEPITDGKVEIDGDVVNQIPAAQRGLAMVFQSYALYPHMTVEENLKFGLENLRMPREEVQARVQEAAKMLQIEPLLSRRPGQLSGGQRQRVAIGRTVVREPRIFLFDEPLSNLDAELRVAMRGEVAALHKRLGNTMVYVTHDQVEAMTMADKIAVLRDGRVEQYGAPLELYNLPANRFVAGFIGSPKMNFLPAQLKDGTLSLGDQVVQSGLSAKTDDPNVTLGIRPNHLTVDDKGPVLFNVESVEQLGGESYLFGQVRIETASQEFTLHMAGQTAVRPGDQIRLSFDVEHMHIFDAADQRL